MTISEVVLQGLNDNDNDEDKVAIRRVRSLIQHTEYMLPGSRGFGMSGEYVDENPEEMENDFAADLYDKIEKYVPEVDIEDIEWKESDTEPGTAVLYITLERRPENGIS